MKWLYQCILFMGGFFLLGATHVGPSYATRPYYAIDAFGKKLSKEYQLEFVNSGIGSMVDAKEGIWALSLISRHKMTLDEGRKLGKAIAEQLVHKVMTDPLFAKYCAESKKPLKSECAAFRLAFWDENNDRPSYPFLSQIRFADGVLYYYYCNPQTQALSDPFIESYPVQFP